MNRRSFLTALVALPATQTPMPAQAVAWRPLVECTDPHGRRGWVPSTTYRRGDIIEFMLDGRRQTLRVHS